MNENLADIDSLKITIMNDIFLKKMYFLEDKSSQEKKEMCPLFIFDDQSIQKVYNLLKEKTNTMAIWLHLHRDILKDLPESVSGSRKIYQAFFKEICRDFFSQHPIKTLIFRPIRATLGMALSDVLINYLEISESNNLCRLVLSHPFSLQGILKVAELLAANTSIKNLEIGESLFFERPLEDEKAAFDAFCPEDLEEEAFGALAHIFQVNKNIKFFYSHRFALIPKVLKNSKFLFEIRAHNLNASFNTVDNGVRLDQDEISAQFREVLTYVETPIVIIADIVRTSVKGIEKMVASLQKNINILSIRNINKVCSITDTIHTDPFYLSYYKIDREIYDINTDEEVQVAWKKVESACTDNLKNQSGLFFAKYLLMLVAWKFPQVNSSFNIFNPDIIFSISTLLFESLHPHIQSYILQDIQKRILNAQCSSAFFSHQNEADEVKVAEEAEELEKVEEQVMPVKQEF